jgi:hypothetical protein
MPFSIFKNSLIIYIISFLIININFVVKHLFLVKGDEYTAMRSNGPLPNK